MKLNREVLCKLPLALRIQIEENAQRKPLTQSELAAEQKRILDELRKHKAPGTRTDRTPVKALTEVRATKIVGKLFGESHMQVSKRLAVVDAADSEPRKYSRLLADMDRTGRVNGPYRRLKNAQRAELLRAAPPPLPNGQHHVGQADCPWAYEPGDKDAPRRGVLPYPTLSIEQLCALPVAKLFHANAILWFWVTNFILARGLHLPILRAWGFEPKTILTWPKIRDTCHAHWLKGQTEHVVMAVRGQPVIALADQTTLLRGPFHLVRTNTHSAKPREAYDFIERLCPAPSYVDLFSRYQHNARWVCHGDEAPDAAITSRKTMEAAQ